MNWLAAIVCCYFGHKERRLSGDSRIWTPYCEDYERHDRQCSRCGRTRLARKRKSPTKGIK